MRAFKLLIVLFLLTPFLFATNSFSQSQASQIIPSSGVILPPTTSQNLLFQTDFSDIQLASGTSGRPNYFYYVNGSAFPFRSHINYQLSSARAEIVDDAEALGGKALEIEVYPGMASWDRCDVNVYIQDLGVTNEFYVDSRLKLRSDYDLASPIIDGQVYNPWHEIIDLFSEWSADVPYYYIPLHVDKDANGFKLRLSLRYAPNDGTANSIIWNYEAHVNLPRGEPFHLRYYVLRHPTNGAIKVWINDTLIFDVSGEPTMLRQEYFTTPAKTYGGDILPEKKLWLDQLRIYDGNPE